MIWKFVSTNFHNFQWTRSLNSTQCEIILELVCHTTWALFHLYLASIALHCIACHCIAGVFAKREINVVFFPPRSAAVSGLDTIGTISSLWFGSSEESFSEEGRRGHNINMWKQIKWKFSSLNQPSKMLFGIVWIVCLTNTFGPRPYSGEPKVAQINALYVVWGALVGGVLVRFPDTHVSRGSPNLTRGALTPGHRWRQKTACSVQPLSKATEKYESLDFSWETVPSDL